MATSNHLPRNAELEPGAESLICLERDPDLGRKGVIFKVRMSAAKSDIQKAELRLLGEGKTFDALSAMAIRHTTLEEVIDIVRLAYVSNALALCHGNQCEAAKLLGIHRNTVARIIGADY